MYPPALAAIMCHPYVRSPLPSLKQKDDVEITTSGSDYRIGAASPNQYVCRLYASLYKFERNLLRNVAVRAHKRQPPNKTFDPITDSTQVAASPNTKDV